MKSTDLSTQRPSRSETTRERMMRDITDTESNRMRRLSVEVDEALFRRIKVCAATEDRTISEITRTLWDQYLNK